MTPEPVPAVDFDRTVAQVDVALTALVTATSFDPPAGKPPVGASGPNPQPTTLADALARMFDAEDTLRAIAAGEIDALIVTAPDAESQVFTLATADRPYRMFVENMRDGAATVSDHGLIMYANGRLAELLRRPKDEVVGASLARFVVGAESVGMSTFSDRVNADPTLEIELLDSSGTAVPVLVGISPLEIDGDRLTCLTFTDLTPQKAQDREIARLGHLQTQRLSQLQDAQAALTRQATHDALTDLPNRSLLMDRIDQALVQARRTGFITAVFFVDLDSFKRVNDTHGHAAGDDLLRETARQLVSVLRQMDTVARIGGDEFVVLAHDIDNEMHAVDIGARLVGAIAGSRPMTSDDSPVSASIGIAISVAGRGTAESLLNEADAAMYEAKAQGGGRVAVFDSALGLQAQQRATAQRRLQSALDQRRVLAFYQPIVDLADESYVGFEALARLSGPDGEIVQPYEFIAVAEESGLIVPLGSQVLELACAQSQTWARPGSPSPPLTVAVNLSSRQFENGLLVDTIRRQLDSTGLSPDRLHLELTETATIDLRHHVLDQLGQLRDLGVEIGLDDFGTGYGSLTHLRRLPLTFVKIDQTFVQGLGTEPGDERIVSAVVNLAANLGLRSIAEGVETAGQLAILRELGCDQAQGYYFARPMPAENILAALARSGRDDTPVVA